MASALANRYARALVDVVTGPAAAALAATPDRTAAELEDFVRTLRESSELRHVLLSPAVAPEKKRTILSALSARLGLSRATLNFIRVVIDHRRVALLDEMLAAFRAMLDERAGIVRADVLTPRPVDPEQESALAARLGQLTGKKVRLHFSVDPALLGGVIARIGSTIYDGSIRGQLHALQRRLSAG
jgi:F-type H+-transporting ATPase subunit delta